jgi:hypothetical protein
VISRVFFQFNDTITLTKELGSVAKVLKALPRAFAERPVIVWKNQLGLSIDNYPWFLFARGQKLGFRV